MERQEGRRGRGEGRGEGREEENKDLLSCWRLTLCSSSKLPCEKVAINAQEDE